jgi:tRNA G18 (ribose-2'-O)-methylase SpoU
VSPLLTVTGTDDPAARALLSDYLDLTDVDLRRHKEAAEGLFVAEGEKVVRRALDAGYPMRSLLLTEKWLAALEDVVSSSDVPVLVADDAVLEQVTGYHVHRGALGAFSRLPLPSVSELVTSDREAPLRIVVLEDVNDHTNVGAIFRSAAALGIDAAILSPRCADPLYRRSVKVSMGAVFSLPYARMTDWREGLTELQAAGVTLLALTPAADAVPLDAVPPDALRRCALLLGAEGPGLSSRWLERADLAVRIPMQHGIDSLNVAAAATVACWVVTHPTSPGSDGEAAVAPRRG